MFGQLRKNNRISFNNNRNKAIPEWFTSDCLNSRRDFHSAKR